jgi:hypothetical protein
MTTAEGATPQSAPSTRDRSTSGGDVLDESVHGSGEHSSATGARRWVWAGLAVVLAGGLGLRLWGVRQGLPYAYNVDEADHFVPYALKMFGHSLNPVLYAHLGLNDVSTLAPLTLSLLGIAGVLRKGRARGDSGALRRSRAQG